MEEWMDRGCYNNYKWQQTTDTFFLINMESLTCIFNVIWEPEKKSVANQFSKEQAQ